MTQTDNNTCSTCHWWCKVLANHKTFGVCVLHNGAKGLHIVFGGTKSLETAPTFGCNQWKEDERPNVTCDEQSE